MRGNSFLGGKRCSFLLGSSLSPLLCVMQQSRQRDRCTSVLSGLFRVKGLSQPASSPEAESPRKADRMETGHWDMPDILPICHTICHQGVRLVLRTARKGRLGAGASAGLFFWLSFLCVWIRHWPSLGISVSPKSLS